MMCTDQLFIINTAVFQNTNCQFWFHG